MKWFSGSIPQAIQLAKRNQAVFIVYVEGNDDSSKVMCETWDNTGGEFDSEQDAVCLKLEADSDPARQFSQLYPVIVLPSTYFIGLDGTPLEILGGNKSLEELLESWAKVKEAHEADKSAPTSPVSQPPPQPAPAQASTSAQPEAPAQASAQGSAQPEMTLEERKALAQAKLEQKRQERLEREREEEKRKDKEQREIGKNVTKLRQWQKEQEEKQTMNEWKKDKEEAKRYKEKIKQDIARDRAERAARFNKEKAERDQKVEEKKAQSDMAQQQEKAKAEAIKRETARLQFRLPDGSSFNEQFASSETLGAARTVVKAKVGNRMGNGIAMSTLYPKRTFSEGDMSATLLDLQLAPSAVILVTPSTSSTVSQSGSGDPGIFLLLLAPFLALWNFICNFLFASPPNPGQGQGQGQAQDQGQSSEVASSSSQESSTARRRPKSSYGIRSRRDGNIQRLTADSFSDDDDNATWNGNSTQQM